MRLGVLDIGSNTVHLLVADVHPGGRPLGTTSQRTVLRLMRYLEPDGSISEQGVAALVDAVTQARATAEAENVVELLATATSAVREATNGADVIARIEAALGQDLQVLGGESEARFTFLAVRFVTLIVVVRLADTFRRVGPHQPDEQCVGILGDLIGDLTWSPEPIEIKLFSPDVRFRARPPCAVAQKVQPMAQPA